MRWLARRRGAAYVPLELGCAFRLCLLDPVEWWALPGAGHGMVDSLKVCVEHLDKLHALERTVVFEATACELLTETASRDVLTELRTVSEGGGTVSRSDLCDDRDGRPPACMDSAPRPGATLPFAYPVGEISNQPPRSSPPGTFPDGAAS